MKSLSNLQGRTKAVGEDGFLTPLIMNWINSVLGPAVKDRTPLTIPGPYANDAAAQAGGVAIGSVYYDASGTPHVRIV